MATTRQDTVFSFDFTMRAGRMGWEAAHDLAPLSASDDGLVFTATGGDPYAFGPDISQTTPGAPLWLTIRLKTRRSGTAQIFWFDKKGGPSEPNSVRFAVAGGDFQEIQVPLPALPNDGLRLRFDPPGDTGNVVVVSKISAAKRTVFSEPTYESVDGLLGAGRGFSRDVSSGALTVKHGSRLGAFSVLLNGRAFATGHTQPQLVYQVAPSDPPTTVKLARRVRAALIDGGGKVGITATFADDHGGRWTLSQSFSAGKTVGTIQIETRVSCDRARRVLHLPAVLILPGAGAGSFGTRKSQAVLCGLEYLDSPDTSGSEADLRGEQALRLCPKRHELTAPLMAFANNGDCLALWWDVSEQVAPVFDIPDRHFGGDGHVLGLLFPGSDRAPGKLLPDAGLAVAAGGSLVCRATLFGGRGSGVVPAIQAWTRRAPLPPLPAQIERKDAVRLGASGLQDARILENGLFRHAFPGDFGAQPAADASVLALYLSRNLQAVDPARSAKLETLSGLARKKTRPGDSGGIGHVATEAAPLVFGGVRERLEAAEASARRALTQFAADGTIPYRAAPGKPDLGTTHFVRHANGLAAPAILEILKAASLTGDPELIGGGVARLKQTLDLYRDTVPRGAQTWEVPLHTPDILASAHLVKACVLAYELTGDKSLLDDARYWAWTGVPFVYLTRPTKNPVGLYASIAVFGATQWVAPNWIGLPVQWCGLVYADALYDLARHDKPDAVRWFRIADGLVESGFQQTWPTGGDGFDASRQGLLPDSFTLQAQVRNDVAINPTTLLVPAARRFGSPIYDRRALTVGGPIVHAPGGIIPLGKNAFRVDGWPKGAYRVLVANFARAPKTVRVNDKPAPFDYRLGGGWIVVTVTGNPVVTLG